MAINTAERRRSVAHIARFYSGAGVTANALKDAEWRQEAGRSYSGILAGAQVASTASSVDHRVFSGAKPRRRRGFMNACFLMLLFILVTG